MQGGLEIDLGDTINDDDDNVEGNRDMATCWHLIPENLEISLNKEDEVVARQGSLEELADAPTSPSRDDDDFGGKMNPPSKRSSQARQSSRALKLRFKLHRPVLQPTSTLSTSIEMPIRPAQTFVKRIDDDVECWNSKCLS